MEQNTLTPTVETKPTQEVVQLVDPTGEGNTVQTAYVQDLTEEDTAFVQDTVK